MSLKSMTGFARGDGRRGLFSWHWEARTVNGRGLDIRLRLPPGYEALEQPAREACKKRLARGNCSLTLTLKRESGDTEVRLNEAAFTQVVKAAERARVLVEAQPPSLDGLLSIRGVLELVEPEEDEGEARARQEAMLSDLEDVLEGVVGAREAEGEHLGKAITGQIDEIEGLVAELENAPARTPETIAEKLREQIARLLHEAPRFDEQRLHQEAVLLAAKADIEEELARLKAHVGSARDLLKSGEPAGRRLEFLAQEFNREANTICSKSNDTEITQAGLSLKAVIDQMREQVQNIE